MMVERVKTIVDIPDALLRRAKATAARQGRALKFLVQEALVEKLARAEQQRTSEKPWMVLAGGLKQLHDENVRIDQLVEDEFGALELEDGQQA